MWGVREQEILHTTPMHRERKERRNEQEVSDGKFQERSGQANKNSQANAAYYKSPRSLRNESAKEALIVLGH